MTKSELIEKILKESNKDGNSDIFDKLSDMTVTHLNKLLKVIKAL